MLGAWTYDDLEFALVRALRFESARQVADELLAAADRPEASLDGVTALQARLRAAGVLSQTGDYDNAITVLREIQASGACDDSGQFAVACAFAWAGEAAEAEALARSVIGQATMNGLARFVARTALAEALAVSGHFERALCWADEAIADAGPEPAPTRLTRIKLAGRCKDRVLRFQRDAAADGAYDPDTIRAQRQRRAAGSDAWQISVPPWPTTVDGGLLWWPAGEYHRLIRQLPALAEIIGAPWREHTARVELALTVHAGAGERTSLVAAEFVQFVRFLEESGTDPQAASTMASFTKDAAGSQPRTRWPPGRRRQCWCQSGNRYQDCCGVPLPAV